MNFLFQNPKRKTLRLNSPTKRQTDDEGSEVLITIIVFHLSSLLPKVVSKKGVLGFVYTYTQREEEIIVLLFL